MQGQKEQRLCVACNIKGSVGAKQLCQALWEDKIRNWTGYDFLFVKNSGAADALVLDGDVDMVNYRLLEGVRTSPLLSYSFKDALELQAKPKKAGTTGTRKLVVTYSPFSEREKQVCSFLL